MRRPYIPQIESILGNCLLILIGAPAGSLVLTWMNGELHGWKDIPRYLDNAVFTGFMMMLGWLVMKSPLAAPLKALITSIHADADGGTTSAIVELTASSGAKVTTTDKGIVVEPIIQQGPRS